MGGEPFPPASQYVSPLDGKDGEGRHVDGVNGRTRRSECRRNVLSIGYGLCSRVDVGEACGENEEPTFPRGDLSRSRRHKDGLAAKLNVVKVENDSYPTAGSLQWAACVRMPRVVVREGARGGLVILLQTEAFVAPHERRVETQVARCVGVQSTQ